MPSQFPSNAIIVEYRGLRLALSGWGRKIGLSRQRVSQIYQKGGVDLLRQVIDKRWPAKRR